jgi:hypothetical protein
MTNQDDLNIKTIELITRKQLSSILKIGLSSLDLISEEELPRVHLGKSIRFSIKSVNEFIIKHENPNKGTKKC